MVIVVVSGSRGSFQNEGRRGKLGKKKKKILTSRLAVVFPTRPTGNDFLLKGGLKLAINCLWQLFVSNDI